MIGNPADPAPFVGLYPEETFQSLPVFLANDQPGGSSVTIGALVVPPAVDPQRSQTGIAFFEDDQPALTLVESRPGRLDATPGGKLAGTLVFGSVRPVARDYTIFLHLDGPPGTIAQDDARPRRGAFPTQYWQSSDLVQHDWQVHLPPDAPPGEYQLNAGWYDLQTGQRLRTNLGDSVDVGHVVIH